MKKKRNVAALITCIIIILFGSIFVGIGLLIKINNDKFIENSVPIKAQITNIEHIILDDGESQYITYVTFEYEGITYSHVKLGYYSNNLLVGQDIDIYFNTNTKTIRSKDGFNLILGILIGIGAVIISIGFFIFIISLFTKQSNADLKASGIKYTGVVEYFEYNSDVDYSGYTSTVFYCTYKDKTGVNQFVKSSSVLTNPAYTLPPGYNVDIYVNPKNPSRYFVDVVSALCTANNTTNTYTNNYYLYNNNNNYNTNYNNNY